MNDEKWERVKEVFHEALRVPVEQRRAFLDAACGKDDALRSEVEELLTSHDEVGDDGLTSRAAASDDTEVGVFPVEGPGTMIDRYKLLEKMGEGGMGVVYLAEQQEPVRRKVALKIIKLGMDTKQVIARFEAERQALAMMDHTNIAKVLDAGTTEQGRPYFVMEHVPGIPITEYCDRHRLNARERLQLYIPVCKAIHHAHQRAIIHRDVKPANVLVMVQDGEPVPKVIDFGVAKATNQRLTEKTLFTGQGVLIGTPLYMSPEQAEMTGLNVDTTTDVYSLGAMLYELLAGAPPFDPKSLREVGLLTIHQMICKVEPPKPSTRFGSLGDEATTVAQRRRTEPATLERQIRGELDWITMRAMEKDRNRRYQSASEFAADIERYLRDEPVVAGPPSTIYRIRKFTRRHKAAVGLAFAGFAVLIAFAMTMTVQANRIARERDHARLEAARNRAAAEVVQALLLDEYNFFADSSIVHIARRVGEAWDLNRRSFAEDGATLALYAVNLVYLLDLAVGFGSGDKTAALELKDELDLEAARLINHAIAAGDTSIFGTVDLMIARLQDWVLDDGKTDLEAPTSQLYRDAIGLRRTTRSQSDVKRNLEKFAQYLEKIGRRALEEERLADAVTILRELVDVRFETHPPGKWNPNAIAMGLLGESLAKLDRYAEAEPLLLESLDIFDTRDTRLRLIALYESWGKPAEADRYREGLWVESVRELGAIGTPEARNMELRSSGFFMDRSVWVFSGGARRPNRWAWTDDTYAGDGVRLYEPTSGRDRVLLPLTANEQTFNDTHTDDPVERWLLRPGPVIADPQRQRALVVYTKVRDVEGNKPQSDRVGYSLAVWMHPDSAVIRPIIRPESQYPTLLFEGGEPDFGAGAVVDGDFLYLYASGCPEWLDCGSVVARARLSDALDPSAWRFFAGDGNWTRDLKLAVRVVNGATDFSVHWNPHLGKYVAVYTPTPFGTGASIQTADRPEGPWSPARQIVEGIGRVNDHHARAHPVLSRDAGRVEYISLQHAIGGWQHETRLVEITFK